MDEQKVRYTDYPGHKLIKSTEIYCGGKLVARYDTADMPKTGCQHCEWLDDIDKESNLSQHYTLPIILKRRQKLSKRVHLFDTGIINTACIHGHLPVLQCAMMHGVKMTADNNLFICTASEYGHLDIVRFLIEQGADVSARNNLPIRCAMRHLDMPLVELLLKNGADPCQVIYGPDYYHDNPTGYQKLLDLLVRYNIHVDVEKGEVTRGESKKLNG